MLEMIFAKLNNLEKCVLALTNRKYGERTEKALSDCKRVETKEDMAIDELDASLADTAYLVCELMKGE